VVQGTLEVKEEIITIFSWLAWKGFHLSILFTVVCSCQCANDQRLRKI